MIDDKNGLIFAGPVADLEGIQAWFKNIIHFPGNIMLVNGTYIICVKAHLDDRWFQWFDGLTISRLDSGETLISSPKMDQSALFGVLHRIRDLGIELIFVQKYSESQHPNSVAYQLSIIPKNPR